MSTTPDAIQTFVAAEEANLTAIGDALTAIGSGVTTLQAQNAALQSTITQLQNSAGQITDADQALLDQAEAQSAAAVGTANALAQQVAAITTTTPGQTVPVVVALKKQ